ncbi:MAG: glycosyltransferase family 39 protein [Oscillospiraceae bacterium]|nr:glycosyltransferase family 39 protein [Oscillospiraceae bacterium]
MTYLIENHHFPAEDVRDYWQFAHPPLHHLLGAFWIECNEKLFGIGYDQSRESVQTLTLFYSMCIMITAYQILRHFKIEGKPLYIALGIINFHPAFILFSGSINNDVLSVVFIMGAILTTLQWYQNPTLKNILKISLCVGLGMMTKLTVALIAPPVALVFLIIFFQHFKSKWKEFLKQFSCFLGICVPLGLWYPVRSWLKWQVPILFVYPLGEEQDQYIADKTFSERIFDFSAYQFKDVYLQWLGWNEAGEQTSYNEFNPLIALLKTSVFGEGLNHYLFENFQWIYPFSKCFFWLNTVLAVFAFLSMLIVCFTKCSVKPVEKLFFLSFYTLLIGNFYKSADAYPLVCTMNFRYITPTVIIGALFTALFLKKHAQSKAGKIAVSAMHYLSFGFIFLSSFVYLTAGFCSGE